MASNPLRTGYRFRPTDVELLNHFLPSKIDGDGEAVREIPELDICKFEPWQLPAQSPIETIDDEWFFFYPMNRKYKKGDRLERATEEGFWKSTGRDKPIKSADGTVIGTRKTLVFHIGRSPKGRKTDWYLHEYRSVPEKGSLLLCKLIKKANKKLDGRQDEQNIVETNVSSSAIAEDMQSEPVTADGAGDIINIPPDPELEAVLVQMLEMETEVANNMYPDHEVQEGIDDQEFEDLLQPFVVAFESEAPNFDSHAEVGQQQNNERAPAPMEMPVGANRTNDITTEEHFIGQHSVAIASTSNQPYDLFNSPLESGYFSNAYGNGNISGTGIRIRTRQSHSQPTGRNSRLQGTAPRRIRLQTALQDLWFEDENLGAKPVTAKAEEAEEKYSMPVGHDASKDENIDASLSKPNSITEVAQELGLDFQSRSDFPIGDENETLPVSLKAISPWHRFRYNILRVLVIVGFFIVLWAHGGDDKSF